MRKTWLALPLALAFLVPTFFSAYSAEKITVGDACSSDMNAADWDTIMQCVSNQWKRGPYFFGSTADACNAANKGLLQWTGTDFKACTDGVNWSAFGSSSTVTLGTATGSTNPQRSGDATTGLVSLTATSVGTVISGTERLRVTSSGVGIGTASPGYNLHVQGTAYVSGNISTGGTVDGYDISTGAPNWNTAYTLRITSVSPTFFSCNTGYGSYLTLGTNTITLTNVQYCGTNCPIFYSFNGKDYIEDTTIIHKLAGKFLESTQEKDLSNMALDGPIMKGKIVLNEPEISYIDSIILGSRPN